MCQDIDQQDSKAEKLHSLTNDAIDEILANSGEVERIIIENASDIARVYCLSQDKHKSYAALVVQQIDICIKEEAESQAENEQ